MKITSVEIFDIHTDLAPDWHPVILQIHTDEDITGLGEVGLAYGTGHTAGVGMVKDLVEAFVLGADPFKSEKLWEDMLRLSFWGMGGGPVVYGGMSAIDIALWDIKGKALGVPVYQLLGGQTNPKLRAYASQLQYGWGKKRQRLSDPAEYAEAALAATSEGYTCVKVDPLVIDSEGNPSLAPLRGMLPKPRLDLFEQRVKAIRQAVGRDVDIILDLHALPSRTTLLQLAQIWREYDCIYFEESVHSLNSALQRHVTGGTMTPMAAGERLYTRWGYREYLESSSLSLIQPDLQLAGGITEGKKICDFAHIYDVQVQLHVCGSPVATAAALQLETVIPNFFIHEHNNHATKPYNTELCLQDYQPRDGYFEAPDLPGLGIALNIEVASDSPSITVR